MCFTWFFSLKNESRRILKNYGYELIVGNVCNIGGDPYAAISEVQPANNNANTETKPELIVDDLEALNIDDLLSECTTLKEKFGINIPEHFNRKTPADEIRAFIRRERKKREKSNAEKLGAKILLTIITSLEFLNNKFDPFD